MLSEGITAEELNTMVECAAITSHERGNRRFHQWVFSVRDGTVEYMSQLQYVAVTLPSSTATKSFTAHAEHEPCEGEGCKECGYIGYLVVTYQPSGKTPERRGK